MAVRQEGAIWRAVWKGAVVPGFFTSEHEAWLAVMTRCNAQAD